MTDELFDCYDVDYSRAANDNVNAIDLILLPLLGLFSLLFVLESALLIRLPYLMRRFYICGSLSNDEKKENKVTIIRGVPGSGKKYYVYHCEKDKKDTYALCDWNEYFTTNDGSYKFKGSELGRAEQYSRLKFIRAISDQIKRIYVVGYFNEEWMYYEYEKLAKVAGYSVEIVDIECLDHRHLMHFNKRSSHNTPYSKSLKCYNNWEYYESNTRQEPFIENFPGDVIPSYGVVTRSQLDKQLEDYRNNRGKPKCLIQTESDDEDEKDTRDYSDVFIEYLSNSERDTILEREFYYEEDCEVGNITETEKLSDDEEIVNSAEELEEKTDTESEKEITDEDNTKESGDEDWINCSSNLDNETAVKQLEDFEYIEGYGADNESITNE